MSRGSGAAAAAAWLEAVLVAVCLSSVLVASSAGSRLPIPVTPGMSLRNASNAESALSHHQQQQQQQQQDEEDEEEESRNNSTVMRCDDARLRCAYRTGCGRALQNYLSRCASVIHGDVNECPEVCQYALIALTSTDEGKELMTCDCTKDDVMCRQSKQRAEVCRSSVTTAMNRTRVSCRVATWICNADALCSTALQYYNENCKRMFHGKKCTKRCLNSINILRRQEKAAKLNTCFCDGAEDYDCNAIHRNMDELCFNKPSQHHNKFQEHDSGGAGSSANGGAGGADSSARPGSGSGFGGSGDTRTNKVPTSAGVRTVRSDSASWRILLFGLVLLLHTQLLVAKE